MDMSLAFFLSLLVSLASGMLISSRTNASAQHYVSGDRHGLEFDWTPRNPLAGEFVWPVKPQDNDRTDPLSYELYLGEVDGPEVLIDEQGCPSFLSL